MVVRNKAYVLIDKYRDLLKLRQKRSKLSIVKGNRSKNRILDFYLKHNRWPKRTAVSKREKSLACRFENFVSKESLAFDSVFRRLVLALGRKSNNKRKHDVSGFKKQIIEFIKEHGRVPTTYSGQKIEGEGKLRSKLDYYTVVRNDMTFLGKVYEHDKCHRSGIPTKYRPIINKNIEIEKPIIRLVK